MKRNLGRQVRAQHSSNFVAVAALGVLFVSFVSSSAQEWTLRTSAPTTNWSCVASSADGTKLVAAVFWPNRFGGGIYTSSDSGVSWRMTSAPATNWSSVASSADGTKLVATVYLGGIYTSSNSGTNWTLTSAPFADHQWWSVACSADGTKLVAVAGVSDGIYTSQDSGTNWTEQPGASETNAWNSVACSADGTKIVAVTTYSYPDEDGIYVSWDSGTSWTHPSAPRTAWLSVASSADGTKLVAAEAYIYTSSDAGTTWTQTSAPTREWGSITSSADGTKLVAVNGFDGIYTSSDSGTNWTHTSAPAKNWYSVASSADGTKLVAVVNGGGIYTFDASSATKGSLRVSISPAAAITAGAKWEVAGGTPQSSEATVANLSAGDHTVSFTPISGWTTPADQTVTITNGTTTQATGVYKPKVKGNARLTITSPKSGQSVSNALLLITGTVPDKVAVNAVYYQLNKGIWSTATTSNGWTNWSASVTLEPGANALHAYAVDTSGSLSATGSVSFTYVVKAPLQVTVTGAGTVSPKFDGQWLEVGKQYRMTAHAAGGFAFHSWSGSLSTNRATISFTMASNLAFTANFVDVKRPLCVITFPAVNHKIATNLITAVVKAKDNVGVSNVRYQLDGAGWNPAAIAAGGTSWTAADLALLPGARLLQAFALDGAGNASLTNSVKFVCIGSPVSLAGMNLTASAAATGNALLSFGANTFSQTGGSALHGAGVGSYTYAKTGSAGAEIWLTYDAPPTATNEPSPDIYLNLTTLNSGLLTNVSVSPAAYVFATKPAKNLAPDLVASKTLVATVAGRAKTTVVLAPDGSFTTSASPGIQEYGTYSYARYSPAAGMLTLLYQDPAAPGAMNYVQLTFTTMVSGALINTLYHADGSYKGTATATFTLQ
jgi:hypothetical protein